jgi:hypothetical protein
LPWSTCPIVPTFTCGFFRSNLPFAIRSLLKFSRVVTVANPLRARLSRPEPPDDWSPRAGSNR